MNPIEHIRTKIFNVRQAEFAAIAGTTQPTVSRWEAGTAFPDLQEMTRIRAEAATRGLPWDDAWFYSAPTERAVA